ncbi:MAG: hypothetical protein KO464_02185 [Candidatus Methanofastidiosum sp.]|nr:hypothetical protein [Methanofastidiosum sp.]
MEQQNLIGFLAGDDIYAGEAYKKFTNLFRKLGGLAYLDMQEMGVFLDSNIIHMIKAYQSTGLMRGTDGIVERSFLPDITSVGSLSSLVWSNLPSRFDIWAGMNLDLSVGSLPEEDKTDLRKILPLFEYWISRSFEGLYGPGLTWLVNSHVCTSALGSVAKTGTGSTSFSYASWLSDELTALVTASGLPRASRGALKTQLTSAINTFASSGTATGILSGNALGTTAVNWRTHGTILAETEPGQGIISFATKLSHDYGCLYPEIASVHVAALLWALCHASTGMPLNVVGHYLTALSRFIGGMIPGELPINAWDWAPVNKTGILIERGDMLPDPYFSIFLRLLRMKYAPNEYSMNGEVTTSLLHPYLLNILTTALTTSEAARPLVKDVMELMMGESIFRVGTAPIVGDAKALEPFNETITTYSLESLVGSTWDSIVLTGPYTDEALDAIKGVYEVKAGTEILRILKTEFEDLIEEELLLSDDTPLDEETLITLEKQAGDPQVLEALARILEVSVEDLQAVLVGESNKIPARAVKTLLLQGLPETEFAPEVHEHPEFVRRDTPVEDVERLVELDDEDRPVRYYTANDFAAADHHHDDEYYFEDETVNNADTLIDLDSVQYTKDSFARVGHEHPQYLRIGESAYAARAFFDGLTEYGPDYFADIDHEHYDELGNFKYLRIGEPALASLRIGGKTWRDFALKNHNHDDIYYTRDEYDQLFVKRSNIPDIAPAVRAINGLKMFFGNTSVGAGDSIVIQCNKPVACAVTLIGASTHSAKPRVLLNEDGVHISESTGTADCVFTYLIFYTGADANE